MSESEAEEIQAWAASDPRAKKLSDALFAKHIRIEELERENEEQEKDIAKFLSDASDLRDRLITSEEKQIHFLIQILALQKKVNAFEEQGGK